MGANDSNSFSLTPGQLYRAENGSERFQTLMTTPVM
jgi:hypothetical protein